MFNKFLQDGPSREAPKCVSQTNNAIGIEDDYSRTAEVGNLKTNLIKQKVEGSGTVRRFCNAVYQGNVVLNSVSGAHALENRPPHKLNN